jgi:hypothetical protein
MAAFGAEYADNRSTLVLKANLQEGFEGTSEGFEFNRSLHIPFREETTFRAQLRIRNLDHNDKFPQFLQNEMPQIQWQQFLSVTDFRLGQSILEIRVPLDLKKFNISNTPDKTPYVSVQENVTPTKSQKFLLQKIRNPATVSEYSHFSLHPRFFVRFFLLLHGDTRKAFPIEYENFEHKGFVSAGRPESNRRKF